MTPAYLRVLLHYYVSPEPYPDEIDNPPNWQILRNELIALDLIRKNERPRQSIQIQQSAWELTERGEVYIKAVLAVPLPIQRWVMPLVG